MYKSTSQRIKKSIMSMFIGRPISALSGLLVLVLLSRHLTPTEYGLYFAVWAMSEIVILASNLGLMNAVYRYISSREVATGGVVPEGPILQFVLLRFVLLFIFSCGSIYLGNVLALFLSSPGLPNNINIYLLSIIVAEGMARYSESIFDSMLCQGRSQITLIGRTCLRLLGVIFVLFWSELTIEKVLVIEVVATTLGAICSLLMLWRLCHIGHTGSVNKVESDSGVISISRVIKYSGPAYLAQILGLTYGPDALKLILGGVVGVSVLALFGFAFSIASIFQRYMPANLLAGVFRPAFVAASKKDNPNKYLGTLFCLSVKINILFILPSVIFCAFAGDYVLSKLSGGNYERAGSILTLILVGLMAVSVHLVFSLYCLALEKSMPTFYASLFSALCLPLGVLAAKQFGAIGISFVFLLGELIWCTVCGVLLKRAGHGVFFDMFRLFRICLVAIVGVVIGLILSWLNIPSLASALVATSVFLVLIPVAKAFNDLEMDWMYTIFPFVRKFPWSKHA